MQSLRHELIEVDDHRVAPSRLVVARLDQNTLQRGSIEASPFDELRLAPCEFGELRVGVADSSSVIEHRIPHPEVRVLRVRFLGIENAFGSSCFGEKPKAFRSLSEHAKGRLPERERVDRQKFLVIMVR
jgi:hypothetical protein